MSRVSVARTSARQGLEGLGRASRDLAGSRIVVQRRRLLTHIGGQHSKIDSQWRTTLVLPVHSSVAASETEPSREQWGPAADLTRAVLRVHICARSGNILNFSATLR